MFRVIITKNSSAVGLQVITVENEGVRWLKLP